ncbi:MAG: GNAT family N-acetyltransferase [Candidatus Eisenbacteria bacterium]
MSLRLDSWGEGAIARLGAIAAHPTLQPEFELLTGRSLAPVMGDAYNREDCRRIAVLDGADVGLAFALVVPTVTHRFAVFRFGVIEPARRRGVGSALLAAVRDEVLAVAPDVTEFEIASIVPNPAAEGFAAHHGYRPRRTYWLMERPGDTVPAPEWPPGVEIRRFDGSPRDIECWIDVFNRSWQEQDHPILATVADMKRHLAGGMLDPPGMHFALRAGEPVGFVRGALHETRGEIAVVGVVPEERGRGLGRALLRLGSRWLLDHGARHVTLHVDGENERALRLYRQESFEVMLTRRLWSRMP